MPLTFAHPAIILPLAKLGKRWISLVGLVTGSMVPDFEYFIRLKVKAIYGHTVTGLFWFDLPLGLLLVLIYQSIVKDQLIDHLPLTLKSQLLTYKGFNRGFTNRLPYIFVLSVSIIIGAFSHLLWDAFTHEGDIL